MRELEEKERIRIQRREQKEREKFEQELREEEEKLRKQKEEEKRIEYEEKNRVRQEVEFKRNEEEIERKEIMLREVEIQHPTAPCIDFKGVIPSFNSSLLIINTFVLTLPKIVFPSSRIIPYSSRDLQESISDLELPFWTQLGQSENQCFSEVGFIENISKHKIPLSCVFGKHSLHDVHNFNENLFDDFCRCVFDLGGIKLSKLWALKNPLDLRTYPLQEGGDDEYHPTGLFSLGQWPGQFSFFLCH